MQKSCTLLVMESMEYAGGVVQYIPLFYVIWSDDLLTESELSVVGNAVKEDPSLSNEDRKQLMGWLNPQKPPSHKTLRAWQQFIAGSKAQLVESKAYPLAAFSQEVLLQNGMEAQQNPHLESIELNLGIQPNHYHHLFEVDANIEGKSSHYDPKELDKLLLGNNHAAVQDFRNFLKRPQFIWDIVRDKDQFRSKVLGQVKTLAQEGYGAMAYPKDYGGTNDMALYSNIFEQLIYVDGSLTVKFGVQFGLFGGSIQKLGTQKHHDRYLTEAGKAQLLGCFAMTETGHGSNVRGIKTTATYDATTDSLVIHTPGPNDNKEYIGNALHSTMASVFAQLIVNGKNEGVHAVLVPLRDQNHELLPGIRVEDNGYKLGLNGVDNGKIWFHQVRVPRENLLNKYGDINAQGQYTSPIKNPNKRFFTMLGTLVGGRICVAKGANSGAKMALNIAVTYALRRRQFNDNQKMQEDLLMDYPTHQLRLTPAVASTYVYQVVLDDLIRVYSDDIQEDKRVVETQAAALKALITDFANKTIQECREACGGKGYLLENRIGDLNNDVDIFTTFEGDNTVLLQLAAKGVLSDFKSEFNSAGFVSVIKMLGEQLGGKISAINPLYSTKVDKAHLYNPKFHKHAFNYRTRRLTYTLAMRIRDYIKKGVPAYQAFLKVQTHLVALGRAYAQELAYERFTAFTMGVTEAKYRSLLEQLGTLYALSAIHEDSQWYLEHGYLGSNKSKAIRQRVERLCTELRPYIGSLVDGYGIPEHCLTPPIVN